MRLHPLAVIAAAALAGCSPARPDPPKVVYVTVEKTVAVPEQLTRPCPVTRPKQRRVEDVVSAYNANVESLTRCNDQLDKVRELR